MPKPEESGEHAMGAKCMACGGYVDEHGLAPLGEAEEFENFEGAETDQSAATERMRDASGFTEAVQRMAMGGYAEESRPLTEEEKAAMKRPGFNDETMKDRSKASDDYYAEMKRKKKERYGGPTGASR